MTARRSLIKNSTINTFLAISALASSMGNVFANNPPPIVDIYGSKQITTANIKKRLYPELINISNSMLNPNGILDSKNKKLFGTAMQNALNSINKMGVFSYVNVSPIMYPGSKNVYITIDLVDKEDKKRLDYFLPAPKQQIPDPQHLLEAWGEYTSIGDKMFFKEKRMPAYKECPAYHCIYGFEEAGLQKFKPIFTNLVPQYKTELIAVLRNDKDPSKRAAAAYLLAHIKDGNELINILTPSIFDPSDHVRNSVMRVIALTLFKVKVKTFPIDKVFLALNFPSAKDRNKSLAILLALAQQHAYTQEIINKAGDNLLIELKMQQLNVHDLAYQVLKTISGKNYGAREYTAWEQWLKSAKQS